MVSFLFGGILQAEILLGKSCSFDHFTIRKYLKGWKRKAQKKSNNIFYVHSKTTLLLSSISLSSTMLTCKTPPHDGPSEQPVRLTVDSVELLARVPFTYNQDPIINSIQPSRSFVRWGRNVFPPERRPAGVQISCCFSFETRGKTYGWIWMFLNRLMF